MISLLLYVVIVVLIGYVAVWVLGRLAPGHPAIIDNIIWIVVILVILITLLRAFGVGDVAVPRLS